MINPFHTVITHDTVFHADEVFAVAMLREAGYEFELIRTRDKETVANAIEDPSTLVVDVGFKFDDNNNRDHHQDLSLPSSAGMIWEDVRNELLHPSPDYIAQNYLGKFIAAIDAVDTNRDNIYAQLNELPEGFRNVSSIIAGFNRDPRNAALQDLQFEQAVEVARMIIRNEIESAKTYAESEREYQSREILPNNVAVFHTFSTVWKQKGDHQFAVLPHASGWQLQSFDTSVCVVPENVSEIDGFIFRHASGFMATSSSKEALIAFAAELNKKQLKKFRITTMGAGEWVGEYESLEHAQNDAIQMEISYGFPTPSLEQVKDRNGNVVIAPSIHITEVE